MSGPKLIAALGVAALLAGACGGGSDSADEPSETESTTPSEAMTSEEPMDDVLTVRGGVNDPEDSTIAVLEFLPESITVAAGTTVHWTITGPEPHSVSFVPVGEEAPGIESAEMQALYIPAPPTGPYDGTTTISSGLGPLGPTGPVEMDVEFSTAGTYTYFCAIHPLMTGTVTVVEDGEAADTIADVAARGDEEADAYLTEGRATKAALVADAAAAEPVDNGDGTKTWTVEMGRTTEHVDVLAFSPVPSTVAVGDTVTFVNNSFAPHTATFAGETTLGTDPFADEITMPSGEQPLALNGTDFFNTGWLPPAAPPEVPPLEARSFSFEVPEAGTYAYICFLHIPSGMAGQIVAA